MALEDAVLPYTLPVTPGYAHSGVVVARDATEPPDPNTRIHIGGDQPRVAIPRLIAVQVSLAQWAADQAAAIAGALIHQAATSATSLSIGTGAKVASIDQSGRTYDAGEIVRLESASDPTDWMVGEVTAWADPDLSVTVTLAAAGGGSADDWVITRPVSIADAVTQAQLATAETRVLGRAVAMSFT